MASFALELLLIVEKPDRPDLLCRAGVFCDQGQFIYFRHLFINTAESVRPVVRAAPRVETWHQTMSAPGGRDRVIPYVHQGGSIIEEREIPFLKARPDYHCEYAKQTLDPPPHAVAPLGLPQRPKPTPTPAAPLDPVAQQALAKAPATVYLVSGNIVQARTADRLLMKLTGHPMIGMLKQSLGGGAGTGKRTAVVYWSSLEKARAEQLVAVVQAEGIPSAYAEASDGGQGKAGYLQINLGRDTER